MPGGSPTLTQGRTLDAGVVVPQLSLGYSDYEDRADVRHLNLTITLALSAQLSPHLNVSAAIPWHRFRTDAQDEPGTDSSESGVGDAVVSALWSPWTGTDDPERFLDHRPLGFVAGLRLPTGRHDLDRFAGVAGKIVPLGNGTLDLLLGASYNARLDTVRLFDSLILTLPLTEGDDDSPPGVQIGTRSAFTIFNRLGASIPITDPLSGWLALDLQWKDRSDGSGVAQDEGGTFAWLTPGLSLRFAGGTAELFAQIPLGGATPFVTISFSVPF